ncbi:flagellin [Sphingomonas sp. dw_22]|uniref:flagellin n=1 Tax=Sphingomonas sp. dw_22 TaxID=2721175 RepID=UPI001BD5ADF8|nr:flagellin [Sphingomonas sp. dw_22]
MARVATIPLQRTMSDAIQRAQEKLAVSQTQLNTTKKAPDFASLGTETVRNLSAHSLLARQDAQSTVSKRVGTTLSLYQGQIEGIQDSIEDLKQQITSTVGTGQSTGLQEAIEAAFGQLRAALNSSEGGTPLFGGSQTSVSPFAPSTLADAATITADNAFKDDGVLASARIADGVDVTYGISASALGKGIYEAFRTLAQAGDIGANPTDAQMDALKQVVGQFDTGLGDLRAVNAENGRKQNQVESLTKRGDERSLLLNGVIETNEDADLGQVAIDIAQQTTVLQASYSVFAQLAGLSLVTYMK